jgi:uncharacterized protein YjbJ (UPF0337 family)
VGIDDKAENKAQEMYGKAEQKVGKATGDDRLRAEGAADEGKGKQAGEKIKDVFKK